MKNEPMKSIILLLVDDDTDDVRLTRKALTRKNLRIDVHDVQNGIEALAFLRKQGKFKDKPTPDLILTDLNMPKMDGRELLQEINMDEALRDIPLIVLTTSSGEEDILHAYKMNANCFITKPVGWKEFIRVVEYIDGFWFNIAKLPGDITR